MPTPSPPAAVWGIVEVEVEEEDLGLGSPSCSHTSTLATGGIVKQELEGR